MASLELFIRPFLLYGGLLFTIIRGAVVVGMATLLFHLFVLTIVPVRGESMYPTLTNDTLLLVDQVTVRLRPYRRGEIIAFRFPGNPQEKFIKRVIGLPNEIVIIEDGQVMIRRPGEEKALRLREPYLTLNLETSGNIERLLGPVEYFVLGDNRPVSFDSRSFGPIDQETVLGRAWIALWPVGNIRLISHLDPVTISD